MKKQSFIKGTAILMAANAISKILGAVFKIPLCYLLKEEGMAIYNSAFSVYVMLLSFTICGMPLAISKTVSEDFAKGHYGDVHKTVRISLLVLSALGILGSVVLWFFADFFALAMKEAKAVHCIRLIAPAVFFVAVGTVFKSYYQGKSNMTPTAISQVIEAAVKLFAGYGLALYYARLSVEYTAAAAIFGVTIGEVIATLILFLLYLPDRKELAGQPANRTAGSILNIMILIAVPVLTASGVAAAMNLADLAVIRTSLTAIRFTPETAQNFLLQYSSHSALFDSLLSDLRLTDEAARWLYGSYSGYALTIFHLPIGMLGALGVSILPVIAGALAVKNRERAAYAVRSASKITLILSLAAAVVIFFWSDTLLTILFHNTASSKMLRYLAPCLVFMAMSDLFFSVLNACGKVISPFLYSFAGAAVKLLFSYFLIRLPQLNVLGIAVSADIAYLIVFLLSYHAVRKEFSVRLPISLKPFLSAGVMAAVMLFVDQPFWILFPNEILAFSATLAAGGAAYVLSLTLCGYISPKEIHMFKK